jgi:hypothetical protein
VDSDRAGIVDSDRAGSGLRPAVAPEEELEEGSCDDGFEPRDAGSRAPKKSTPAKEPEASNSMHAGCCSGQLREDAGSHGKQPCAPAARDSRLPAERTSRRCALQESTGRQKRLRLLQQTAHECRFSTPR